jgi:hypothetical protein
MMREWIHSYRCPPYTLVPQIILVGRVKAGQKELRAVDSSFHFRTNHVQEAGTVRFSCQQFGVTSACPLTQAISPLLTTLETIANKENEFSE